MKEIVLGILFLLFGIFVVYITYKHPFSKGFGNENFAGWEWGILFIIAGIYTIIKTLIEIFSCEAASPLR